MGSWRRRGGGAMEDEERRRRKKKGRKEEGSSGGNLREGVGDDPWMGGGEGAAVEGGTGRDPRAVLGPDVFARVLASLDARSVARCLVVSRAWQAIAAGDRFWGPMLEDLWRGKAHIPRSSMVRGATKLASYSLSFMDSKRTRITKEDLCDHVWEFHFKEVPRRAPGGGAMEGEERRRRKKKGREEEGSSGGCLREGVGDDPGMGGGEEAAVEGGTGSDPLAVLGPDIFARVLASLDARCVARCLVVSRAWRAIAAGDRLWGPTLEDLWSGKAHIPRSSMTRITKEDLCDHVWEFHFKEAAPSYWLNLDPFWTGTGPLMRRYFHPDGSHTADPDDPVWGGHEATYSIVTSYVDGRIRNHYIRISRWPQMCVSRGPDWGWELNNHIHCYSSLPDAEKEGGTGPLFPVW